MEKVEVYNKHRELVNTTIKKKLGVEVDMQVEEGSDIRIIDNIKTDVDKKMRGNKILRQLFEKIYLYGSFHVFEEEKQMCVYVSVRYVHPGGGSNGRDMIVIYIDTERGKVLQVRM